MVIDIATVEDLAEIALGKKNVPCHRCRSSTVVKHVYAGMVEIGCIAGHSAWLKKLGWHDYPTVIVKRKSYGSACIVCGLDYVKRSPVQKTCSASCQKERGRRLSLERYYQLKIEEYERKTSDVLPGPGTKGIGGGRHVDKS